MPVLSFAIIISVLCFSLSTEAFPDPVAVFAEHCFEANRIEGRSLRPSEGSEWVAADASLHAMLGILDDPATEVFLLSDPKGEEAMVLQVHERILEGVGSLNEGETRHTCRVIYTGPERPEALHERLAKFLDGGDGYSKFHGRSESLKRAGWRQWYWRAVPRRQSSIWDVGSAYTYISDKRHYLTYEHIIIMLQVKETGAPVSIIGLERTFRPRE